jgi:hypothetical protein
MELVYVVIVWTTILRVHSSSLSSLWPRIFNPALDFISPLRFRNLLFDCNPGTLHTMPSYDPYEDALTLMAAIENPDHQKIVKEPEIMAVDDTDKDVWRGSVWENRTWKPACFPSSRTGTLL